jgi:hypothetical protein
MRHRSEEEEITASSLGNNTFDFLNRITELSCYIPKTIIKDVYLINLKWGIGFPSVMYFKKASTLKLQRRGEISRLLIDTLCLRYLLCEQFFSPIVTCV